MGFADGGGWDSVPPSEIADLSPDLDKIILTVMAKKYNRYDTVGYL